MTLDGPNASWKIVLPPFPSPAERTAAAMLSEFLKERIAADRADIARIVLGTADDSARIAELKRSGELRLGDPAHDAFHVKRVDGDVIVAGNNSRGVLFGACRLIDWIRGDRDGDALDLAESPHFRERWMCPTLHGRTDEERNFRYMAHLGVNTSYLRGRRDPLIEVKHLHHYVAEDKFLPDIHEAQPPVAEIVKMATGAYRLAREHGLEIVMFLDEPVAIEGPESANPQEGALPASLLGKLDPAMLGPSYLGHYRENGWKSLSVFHPTVEGHYRELLRKVLELFPDLRTLYVYNEDAAASNVFPPDEPVAKDAYPSGYSGYPYAGHLHLVDVLQAEVRKLKPDLRLCTITYHWYLPDELRRRMVAGLPAGSVLMTLGVWDDSLETTILPEWTRELIRQAKERGDLVLLADDDFTATSDDLLMEVTSGFPMPLRTWKKCRAWAQAGVVGVTQHHTGGPTLGLNAINDLAWRVFTWHPLMSEAEAEAAIRRLTLRQFGSDESVDAMMTCYRAVERALDAVEADLPNRPYCSRLHHSWKRPTFPAHLEHGLKRDGVSTADYIGDGIDPDAWQRTLEAEVAAYTEAWNAATHAAQSAPDDREPFYLWCPPTERMSCRDYATMTADALEVVLRFRVMFLNFLKSEKLSGDALLAHWRVEKANERSLVEVLVRRRRWIQSDYGMRILDGIIERFERKLKLLEKHGV